MRRVVTEGSGTAADASGTEVAGKTGTAEFGSGDPLPTHAWFIGFRGDLALAIVIEGGGVGGRDAAPVAGQIFAALP
jgi:cell division protein FtsI/penicillin-binding protein 2